MTIYLVKFDAHNSDSWVDAYRERSDAMKAAAKVAADHAGDIEVTKAFDAGDYDLTLKLFRKRYEITNDYYLEVEETELK